MGEVKDKCKYENKDTGWQCPYEALYDSSEGFCIFHDRRKGKDAKKFNEGIKKILEDEDLDAYHFEGFFFPKSVSFHAFRFKKNVYMINAEFSGEYTDFREAEFSGKNTDFTGAKFSGAITDFRDVKFSGGNTEFTQAKFLSGETRFSGTEFSGRRTDFTFAEFSGKDTSFFEAEFSGAETSFYGAEFSGEDTNFDWAKFSGVGFNEAKFSGRNTSFVCTKFLGKNTSFNEAGFSGENTNFYWTEFLGQNIDFSHTEFSGKKVNFYRSIFGKRILFHQTIFEANTSFVRVDLTRCVFTEVELKNVDFSLLEWAWNHKLANEIEIEKMLKEYGVKKYEFYLMTSEMYRQLKVQFHSKRDFAKAGMFHFREQECKRKACKLSKFKDFFKWASLRILKWSCGYGEKLWKVLASSVELIVAFAIIYMWWFGLYTNDQNKTLVFQYKIGFENTAPIWTITKDFFTSLSFSIKGFFPLWRFQQYKVVGDFANLVAGIEFLLGAFMIGLFVYVFRRRMEK